LGDGGEGEGPRGKSAMYRQEVLPKKRRRAFGGGVRKKKKKNKILTLSGA